MALIDRLGSWWGRQPRWVRWPLWLLGTLLLGGLGNGAWEYVLAPSFWRIRNLALDLVSWGITSQKDDVYQQVARGFSDRPATLLYSIVTIGAFWATIGFFLYLFRADRSGQGHGEMKELVQKAGITGDFGPVDERIVRLTVEIKKLHQVLVGGGMVLFLLTGSLVVGSIKMSYANSAIAAFRQHRDAVAPVVSREFIVQADADLARIRTASDYHALMNRLRDVASKNSIYVAPFNAW